MTTDPSAPEERAALRRTEAVMRVLAGVTTIAEEAARQRVDVAEVQRWIRRARIAVASAMRRSTTETGNFEALATKPTHVSGVFWASGPTPRPKK